VDTLCALLGSGGVSSDEPVREDDDRIYRIVHQARELGAGDEQLARVVRAMSDAVRRIVRTERDFVDEVLIRPAAASGASPKEILESTSAVRPAHRAAMGRTQPLRRPRGSRSSSARVAEACGGVEDLSFAARAPVVLRNVGRPVGLFLAQWSGAP
jgi:hypothetical protein